ncbi:MAG: ATP-binding protein [Catenulispora sp.]|nr:ATP-binding protein [Catenulispora sp.]
MLDGDLSVRASGSAIAFGAARTVNLHTRQSTAGAPVRLDLRPVHVAGREPLLGELRDRLAKPRGVSTVALTGLGGVGKTTVALEYAHRHVDDYEVVWFFHAEHATTLLSQFHELAQLLGVAEDGDPVAAVHGALGRRTEPWLLVFDNLPGHAAAGTWLPAKGTGHVLVTTQDGHWPATQAIEVPTIGVDAAAGFLMDRTGSADESSARAVATALGLLPLALSQAAAFCETTGRTLDEYQALLASDRAELLKRGAPVSHAPLTATWSLAIGELEANSPGSVTLLRIAAYLAPEEIPFRLLFGGYPVLPDSGLDPDILKQVRDLCTQSFALDDAVSGLRRHSLIGPPSKTFGVHRLVQAVTCDGLGRAGQLWRDMAAALVEAAVPYETKMRSSWDVCRLLLPHIQTVADPLGDPMWRMSDFLGASGDYATARVQWQVIVEASTKHSGPEHPRTLEALSNVAFATVHAGDALSARDQFATLAPIVERVWGAESLNALAAKSNLANAIGQAGEPVAARDMCKELVSVYEAVAGATYPYALTVRADLAHWTGQAGNAPAAREMYVKLLPIRTEILGDEHPSILSDRAGLAYWTGRAGDAETARDMLTELLPIQAEVLGAEHPFTLNTLSTLAEWLGKSGDAAAARDLLMWLLPIRERVSGPDHPKSARDERRLAYWTKKAKRS